MAATDRAFRALGRAEPETILAFVRAVMPELELGAGSVSPEDGLDTWLDRPLHPNEADLVLRLDGDEAIFHRRVKDTGRRPSTIA